MPHITPPPNPEESSDDSPLFPVGTASDEDQLDEIGDVDDINTGLSDEEIQAELERLKREPEDELDF